MTENTSSKGRKLTPESTSREYLDEGLTLVRRTLDNLYRAGLLEGYAAYVTPDEKVMPECGAMIVSCCAGHAAQALHPRIVSTSQDEDLQLASAALAARELLGMFRSPTPEPGPEERRQSVEDDMTESDTERFGTLSAEYLKRDPYDWYVSGGEPSGDDDTGTGMYL